MTTKVCRKCNIEKEISEFEKAKTCKDGRMSTCKSCRLESKKKYIKKCEYCGEEFKTQNKTTRFCSKKCLPQNREVKYKVKCEECGTIVLKTKSQIDRCELNFCSNRCNNIYYSRIKVGENSPRYNKKKIKCDNCGSEFERVGSQIARSKNSYCSTECKHEHQSTIYIGEKHPLYNHSLTHEERVSRRKYEEYYNWRFEVFKRDNFTCKKCGDKSGHNLNAHHIENFSEHEDKRIDIDNGITLCKSCHMDFHKTYGYKKNNFNQIQEFLTMLIPSQAYEETLGRCND